MKSVKTRVLTVLLASVSIATFAVPSVFSIVNADELKEIGEKQTSNVVDSSNFAELNSSIDDIIDKPVNSLSKFDEYVVVENNQYVLKLPENTNFTANEIQEVKSKIEDTNKILEERNLIIDSKTETAVLLTPVSGRVRGAGINKIEWHWNYFRVWLHKNEVNNLLAGYVGGLAALAGWAVAGPAATFLAGFIGTWIGSYVKVNHGIRFDYNFHCYRGMNFKWQ